MWTGNKHSSSKNMIQKTLQQNAYRSPVSTLFYHAHPLCIGRAFSNLNHLKPCYLSSTLILGPSSLGYSIHFFDQLSYTFLCRCPNHLNLFLCNTDPTLSVPNLSLNSTDGTGTLSCNILYTTHPSNHLHFHLF